MLVHGRLKKDTVRNKTVHPLVNLDGAPLFLLARVMIKTSLIFFSVGILSGLYLYGSVIFGWIAPNTLRLAHTHILLMGGVLMMIIGVATWMFPRRRRDRTPEGAKRARLLYFGYAGATALRFLFEVLSGIVMDMNLSKVAFFMAVSQVGCAGGLGLLLWKRIRPIGSHLREAAGERFS